MLPVTRHCGSVSIGLEPSFKARTKNSLIDVYLSRGKAASSKSEMSLGIRIILTNFKA